MTSRYYGEQPVLRNRYSGRLLMKYGNTHHVLASLTLGIDSSVPALELDYDSLLATQGCTRSEAPVLAVAAVIQCTGAVRSTGRSL